MANIPFNKPHILGTEVAAIEQAIVNGQLSGGNTAEFTKLCHDFLKEKIGSSEAFLTCSCTLAMEMAALVMDFQAGDEILVPDFTFVSTAQSVVLRGATPVLCDIRADTLNLDASKLEEAITPKTKAIMPIHYAGVCAEMDAIMAIAKKHNLLVIEDAAQALGSTYKGQPSGSFGDMSAFSFHATKNIHCGEGGALMVNNSAFAEGSSIAWEKGTNRSAQMRGDVQKYEWISRGSSYLASELNAAFLYPQLKESKTTNDKRLAIWNIYHNAFEDLERSGVIQRPKIPQHAEHNGHLYYLPFNDTKTREEYIDFMKEQNIQAYFHYTPLHQSKGGKEYCRQGMSLANASTLPHQLVRLPLYPSLSASEQEHVISKSLEFLERI